MTPTGAFRFGGTALLCLFALNPARALELSFPSTAELVGTSNALDGRHSIATGPWTPQGLPTQDALGIVQDFTWRVTGDDITTTALFTTLRTQIEAQGYAVTFTCFADACGGFDFRHALPVGQAPEMHIDLGDFHYLSATSEDGKSHTALMISRGGATGFVHLALVQPATETPAPVVQSTRTPEVEAALPTGGLISQLMAMGSAPLDDLQFQTGASELSGARYTSLATLAAFLTENPDRNVVLVGHTDASGSLAGNIRLSEARAGAVRAYLTGELGVDPAQVEAQGIGFLAPRAANTTEAGREANRRVEVVLADPG